MTSPARVGASKNGGLSLSRLRRADRPVVAS